MTVLFNNKKSVNKICEYCCRAPQGEIQIKDRTGPRPAVMSFRSTEGSLVFKLHFFGRLKNIKSKERIHTFYFDIRPGIDG